MHVRLGAPGAAAYSWARQNIFGGKMPWTLRDTTPDHATLKQGSRVPRIDYPKPDNEVSFDRNSSVFLSNTNHEEDQPCHLTLKDSSVPIEVNLPSMGRARAALLPGRASTR